MQESNAYSCIAEDESMTVDASVGDDDGLSHDLGMDTMTGDVFIIEDMAGDRDLDTNITTDFQVNVTNGFGSGTYEVGSTVHIWSDHNAKIDYAVLGAHGCGAFENPSEEVAKCYASVLKVRRNEFAVIAFAIYHAGYGPNHYLIFKEVFDKILFNDQSDLLE